MSIRSPWVVYSGMRGKDAGGFWEEVRKMAIMNEENSSPSPRPSGKVSGEAVS